MPPNKSVFLPAAAKQLVLMETIAEEGEPAPEKKAVFVSHETEAQKARRVEAEKARFDPAALAAIAATFQEFGSGKLGDPNSLVLLSEDQFCELCTAMGMVNTNWAELAAGVPVIQCRYSSGRAQQQL